MSLELTYYLFGALLIVGGFLSYYIASKTRGKAARSLRTKYWVYVAVVALEVLAIIAYPQLTVYFFATIAILGSIEMVIALKRNASIPQALVIGSIYLLLLAAFVYSGWEQNKYLPIVAVIVLIFDAFSQLAGQLFGKTPILPSTSPNKTWEGSLGGAVMVIASYLIIFSPERAGIRHPNWTFLISSIVLIVILAFIGDALFSLVKRRLGIKDYSQWLPGHGGINDRFDSLIFASSIVWAVTSL